MKDTRDAAVDAHESIDANGDTLPDGWRFDPVARRPMYHPPKRVVSEATQAILKAEAEAKRERRAAKRRAQGLVSA